MSMEDSSIVELYKKEVNRHSMQRCACPSCGKITHDHLGQCYECGNALDLSHGQLNRLAHGPRRKPAR